MVSGLGFTWFYGGYSYNGQEKGNYWRIKLTRKLDYEMETEFL